MSMPYIVFIMVIHFSLGICVKMKMQIYKFIREWRNSKLNFFDRRMHTENGEKEFTLLE